MYCILQWTSTGCGVRMVLVGTVSVGGCDEAEADMGPADVDGACAAVAGAMAVVVLLLLLLVSAYAAGSMVWP
jgi:hypothetical protein